MRRKLYTKDLLEFEVKVPEMPEHISITLDILIALVFKYEYLTLSPCVNYFCPSTFDLL